MTEGSEWVPKKDGEWYQGADGMWYCWPSRDPYPMPPVDRGAGGASDVNTYTETAAQGSVLAQVDSGARTEAPAARNRHVVRLALLGVLALLTASITAYVVVYEPTDADADPPLRSSVQEVRAEGAGLTPITVAGGEVTVSYAVVWRNQSREDTARDVVLHATLVDAAGATVRDVTRTVPFIGPGQFVAVGEELTDVPTAVQVTIGAADIGSWTTDEKPTLFPVRDVRRGQVVDGLVEIRGRLEPQTAEATLPAMRAVAVSYNPAGEVLGAAATDLPAPADSQSFTISVSARALTGTKRARIYVSPVA